ncbi:cytohesin-1 isoform X2 [Anopheles funestus]|uniref:cytohesin-1 isoform X2 n=1 Tax=Anopheles funestus TaxID=62324 RepID=UPI0020C68705|nr:cytohesin-1 isoform X2 [Anopheles funestus]
MFSSMPPSATGGSGTDVKKGPTNWFWSLRRQPKPKKTILEPDKPLQKSCVDLPSATTNGGTTLFGSNRLDEVVSTSSSSIERPTAGCTCEYVQVFEPPETAGSISTTATITTTVSRHQNDALLESASSDSNLALSSLTSPIEGAAAGVQPFATNSLRRRKEQVVYGAKTVTTVTKTTVLNRQRTYRVGLIFSDNGELLNSNLDLRQLVEESKRNFLNALGNAGGVENSPVIPPPPRLPSDPTEEPNNNDQQRSKESDELQQFSILNDSNFDFIDDSADLFNRNYPHQPPASSTVAEPRPALLVSPAATLPITKVLRMCNNCKNKSNLVYQRSCSQPNRKQINDELNEVESEMKSHESKEENKHSNKDKQMALGRKKFNMDPKKGIEFLYENQLLRTDPQDVAQFLYKGEGLNKTAIGDYLGEKNDFNEQVLKAFVELHDFTNLILVQALRQFLWSFRLPGEAQKIDRMMECFAQRYCQLNPDIFTNTDTCYVLSFAIIMLNTSLHNPSVKEKPTVEQFISMNRGINNGGDLPRELLESLYESIRAEPFKIPQDDGNDLMHTFFNPDKEGWLWKQGGRYKSWKRRWFILNDNCLYYFEYTTDKEPRGIIPLENIAVREVTDRSKPHCFELHASGGADIIKACKTDSEGKVVEGKHTVYRMSAATEEEQQEWINRLNQSISHNPFHDILVQRKKKALAKS